MSTTTGTEESYALFIDLDREKAVRKRLAPSEVKAYLGGRGFNSRKLFEMVNGKIDPLGPENVLALGNGTFAGTVLPMTSRLHVSTISPLSGILGDGNAGGEFAAMMRYAGYDQIVVLGRADKPKYVWIEDETVEFRDAEGLWGMKTGELVDVLRDEHGDDVSVAGIGPAGENLVRFATTMVDKYHAGARGSGAVWGSKNLKAIAIRGTKGVEPADPETFYGLAKEDLEYFKRSEFVRKIYSVIGTHYGLLSWHPGWRYFSKYLGPDELPKGLRPEDLAAYEVGRTQCYSCPLACKDVYYLPKTGEYGTSSEFESIYALGSNNCITDTEAVLQMEHMADEYGMDVITLGDTIALARLLHERGILSDEVLDGVSLEWGDAEGQIELVRMTAYRKGFGNMIAEGYRNFAKLVDREALAYSYDVKGLNRGWYEVDFMNGIFTLAHATSTRGADHLRGRSWAYWENDVNMDPEAVRGMLEAGLPDYRVDPVGAVIAGERACTLADSLGRCKGSINMWFQAVPLVWKYPIFRGTAMLLTAFTGMEFSEKDVVEALDRIYLTEMAINVKQGIRKKHYNVKFPPELAKTEKFRRQEKRHWEMVDEYLERRGCDVETARPKGETLERLGIGYVADEIEGKEFPEWDGPALWPLESYPGGE
ncbi:aldehyde ferredoxin oxidoreductase [Thermococcus profundus]|uniref:Aldehyde ferredoxin oxidoreductase n=2 Tax=Thermococcus profundus TaxID=49899 RepID=A0A2Z2MAS7_THEPR|nr:aldehyde ferredoxin oxidoreductase [Thermococcus profundus]